MTVIDERLPALEKLVLAHGGHSSWEKGACIMEAVAYVAGEPFSDHPKCASNVITSFLISWNDALSDDDRQMLKPLVPRVVGTRTTAADETTRAWMATDWLAGEFAPAFLRLAGLIEHAEKLEQLGALTNSRDAESAQPTLDGARRAGAAARAAAGDAARAAAGAAAGAAAWDAARVAAWDAAWDAAGAAADKVKSDGGDYYAQYNAAYVVAKEIFAKEPLPESFVETTKALQKSAYLLVERMIEVGREPVAA